MHIIYFLKYVNHFGSTVRSSYRIAIVNHHIEDVATRIVLKTLVSQHSLMLNLCIPLDVLKTKNHSDVFFLVTLVTFHYLTEGALWG